MFSKILLPQDGSPLAELAVPYVKVLAMAFQSQVTVLTVCEAARGPAGRANTSYCNLVAHRIRERMADELPAGLRDNVKAAVVFGNPAREILRHAQVYSADLIAMATHGWSGLRRWVLGSVADRVIQAAGAPVFLVRGQKDLDPLSSRWPGAGLLVPLDGYPEAEHALPHAQELAAKMKLRVQLLRVAMPDPSDRMSGMDLLYTEEIIEYIKAGAEPYVALMARRLRDKGIVSSYKVAFGRPAEEILDVAKESGVDLIVMATHGFMGFKRLMLGSIADRVIRGADTPILVVRAPPEGEVLTF